MYLYLRSVGLLALAATMLRSPVAATAGAQATNGDKLQIILMLGQGEMVGRGNIASAGTMLQKPLVPPREATLNAHKAMLHQPNGAAAGTGNERSDNALRTPTAATPLTKYALCQSDDTSEGDCLACRESSSR
jgi:hypothetical protein